MQLKNTPEDNEWLKKALKFSKTVKAKITYGIFTSTLASSLTQITLIGEIFALEEGYIRWKYQGQEMVNVNINCVETI